MNWELSLCSCTKSTWRNFLTYLEPVGYCKYPLLEKGRVIPYDAYSLWVRGILCLLHISPFLLAKF
jgi:hypothetical protein